MSPRLVQLALGTAALLLALLITVLVIVKCGTHFQRDPRPRTPIHEFRGGALLDTQGFKAHWYASDARGYPVIEITDFLGVPAANQSPSLLRFGIDLHGRFGRVIRSNDWPTEPDVVAYRVSDDHIIFVDSTGECVLSWRIGDSDAADIDDISALCIVRSEGSALENDVDVVDAVVRAAVADLGRWPDAGPPQVSISGKSQRNGVPTDRDLAMALANANEPAKEIARRLALAGGHLLYPTANSMLDH